MAKKRYDNQADKFPLYLYEGHRLTEPQQYIDKLNAILKIENPTPQDGVQFEILSAIAFELFGGRQQLISTTKKQQKELATLSNTRYTNANLLTVTPLFALDISGETRSLMAMAEFNELRYNDCLLHIETIEETILHTCYVYNAMQVEQGLEKWQQAEYFKRLDTCLDMLEKERDNIYKTYKAMNCYDIFIDMLADFTGIEELKTLKVNLFEANEKMQKCVGYFALINNAILGIDGNNTQGIYNQIAEQKGVRLMSATDKAEKRAKRALDLMLKTNSRLLRPSLREIDEAKNTLFAIDMYKQVDGISLLTRVYDILFNGIEE